MSKTPIFQINDKVWHKSSNKIGTVTHCFPSDGSYRYYVVYGGHTWSVPEWALDSLLARNRHQQLQALKKAEKQKLPKLAA